MSGGADQLWRVLLVGVAAAVDMGSRVWRDERTAPDRSTQAQRIGDAWRHLYGETLPTPIADLAVKGGRIQWHRGRDGKERARFVVIPFDGSPAQIRRIPGPNGPSLLETIGERLGERMGDVLGGIFGGGRGPR